jgi:hypothetical protein
VSNPELWILFYQALLVNCESVEDAANEADEAVIEYWRRFPYVQDNEECP